MVAQTGINPVSFRLMDTESAHTLIQVGLDRNQYRVDRKIRVLYINRKPMIVPSSEPKKKNSMRNYDTGYSCGPLYSIYHLGMKDYLFIRFLIEKNMSICKQERKMNRRGGLKLCSILNRYELMMLMQ